MTTKLKNIGWVAVGAIVLYWAATTLVGTVFSGPLDPPAPPAETQKTQITSLPYTITAPGSYVVMADLTCPSCSASTDHGIQITSSNVTLDLNGFRVKGPGGGDGGSGIYVSGTRSNVVIEGGLVQTWEGGAGIFFQDCSRCRVEDVVANGNASGIRVPTGAAGVIKDANLTANTIGIWGLGSGSWLVENSIVRNNNSDGITMDSDGNVIQNVIADNNGRTGPGDGIAVGGAYNRITDVSVRNNATMGIRIVIGSNGTMITNATASGNGLTGVQVNSVDNVISGSTLRLNDEYGIYVLGNGNVIRDNVVRVNGVTGIRVDTGGNTVERNSSNSNAVAGIHIASGGNVVIRNTARGNPTANYSIVGGNHVGPIISGPDDPIASDNPWANHEY